MRRKKRVCPTCGAYLPQKPDPSFNPDQEREVLRRITVLENSFKEASDPTIEVKVTLPDGVTPSEFESRIKRLLGHPSGSDADSVDQDAGPGGRAGDRIDGSRSPEGQVGQEDTALRRGGGSQPAPPGLIGGTDA